jgi:hypothetical protein
MRNRSWFDLFKANGFAIEKVKEPINPKTNQPASLIIVGMKN